MGDIEAGSIGAGLGVLVTAIGGVIAKARGSAVGEWRELARQAREDAAECQRRSLETEASLGEIKARLGIVESEHAVIVREHSLCPGRIDQLERDLRHQRAEVALIKRGSTPPAHLYTPEDVRAAMEDPDG